ncbi:MAG TPA: endolytic transglycosylase MltG [bacterium (Candidatus Stahlbacteria)]|nr:endolytic transglycosylase MltG [Candidatus Stahlbacteria bacterium]
MSKIGLVLIIFILATLYNPFGGPKQRIFVYPDESLSVVVDSLKSKNILVSKPWILMLAKLTGMDKEVKPGYYWIGRIEAPISILGKLRRGGADTIRITIPEGFTLNQIGVRLANAGIVDIDTFAFLTNNEEFIKTLDIDYANSLEGFLFPDTYIFSIFSDERQIIRKMVNRFKMIVEDLGIRDSLYEQLILASIVEREARIDSERQIIASIFRKRLYSGHPLESCATVNYALGVHNARLKYSDLRVKSPYNTYLYSGLPPTPICSPGKASLLAVVYPRPTRYLYFVSNGRGGHFFSSTYREHLLAKKRRNSG